MEKEYELHMCTAIQLKFADPETIEGLAWEYCLDNIRQKATKSNRKGITQMNFY